MPLDRSIIMKTQPASILAALALATFVLTTSAPAAAQSAKAKTALNSAEG